MKWFDNLCIRIYVWIQMQQFEMEKQVEKIRAERAKR